MQIKDVHVIFHVLVTWFIQKSGEYAKKTSGSVFFEKKYIFWQTTELNCNEPVRL